jgi:hypothetical protein
MEIITRGFLILSATFFSLSAQAFHSPAGIPSGTTLKTVSPMVLSGKKDVVIRGVRISSPSGSCIIINKGSQNILIENSEIGPCAINGIDIRGSTQVKIQNSYLHDIKNSTVYTWNVTGLHVYNNRIERYKKGVYSVLSKQTLVRHNKFLNGNPWNIKTSGQAVQFNQVTGAGNRVNCNVVENRPGESYTEDVINMYKSSGVSSDPIQIMSNKLKGGGPSLSGTGMLPTDHGSSYVLLKDNIFVDPGTIGTAISSGHHIQIVNNLIYAKKQPFTWTGISIRNQLKSQGYVCYGHTVSGNLVNWTTKGGKPNPYTNDGTCGTIAGFNTNTWNAPIGPSIWDLGRPACTSL